MEQEILLKASSNPQGSAFARYRLQQNETGLDLLDSEEERPALYTNDSATHYARGINVSLFVTNSEVFIKSEFCYFKFLHNSPVVLKLLIVMCNN